MKRLGALPPAFFLAKKALIVVKIKKHKNVRKSLSSANEQLAEKLQQALEAQRAGDLGTAETIYREILQAQPEQPDALHYLGCVHLQRNDPKEAEALIERAIARHALPVMY